MENETNVDTEIEVANWKRTKTALTAAQDAHLQSEIDLFNKVKEQLPKKGTYALGDIKIMTGYSEAWDQEKITQAWNLWPDASKIPFPFSTEWKPDGKQVTYIRENLPDLYKTLSNCLTLKPKKPAFSLKDKD